MSIDNESISELDSLVQKGFSGRSEVIRSAINLLSKEEKAKEKLTGNIEAVLLVKHEEKHSQSISKIRHEFQDLIQSHLHTHLANHECLEIFFIKGDSKKIIKFLNTLETSKKTKLVKLVAV